MKKQFDLIFGVGENCNTSLALRKNNLQISSFPFDWISFSEFKRNIEFIVNDFENFINENDLEYLPDSFNGRTDTYINKRNELHFVHDFFPNIDMHTQYTDVIKKYQKRQKRLTDGIKNSKNVLIVFITTKERELENILKDFAIVTPILKKKFPETQFEYLYLQDSKEKAFDYSDKNNNFRIVSLDNSLIKKRINILGIKISTKIFPSSVILNSYKLKMGFRDKYNCFIYKLRKILINIIPNKDFQLKLRHKSSYN